MDEHQFNQPRADAVSHGGPILLRTKLRPPPVRAGLIPRARLDGLLESGAQGRLCLIDAPAGSGKTTLLAQWCLAERPARRVAWVSLDEGDDDPVRFWAYVIEGFRVIEPGFGETALSLLQDSGSADVLTQAVLPQLLNELATVESELVLILDDYHLVTDPDCHRTLAFFVDHLPANVHLMVATRVDRRCPWQRPRRPAPGQRHGAHYRHTTPEMAARVVTAIQARLTIVVHTAEDALEAQPTHLSRRVF